MATQVSYFSHGGFVVHKIVLTDRTHASAWYDKEGKLQDHEIFANATKRRRAQANPGSPSHDKLESVGRIYRQWEKPSHGEDARTGGSNTAPPI